MNPCYSKDMAKVTSKLQVTIPKALAERYGIAPGAEVDWLPAGEAIRVVPRAGQQRRGSDHARRMRLFDEATERQRQRSAARRLQKRSSGRGWTREELYRRGGVG